MTKPKIEYVEVTIRLTSSGFIYKGWKIEPYEDWDCVENQKDIIWFGAEKQVGDTWFWKKRKCLIELIEDIENYEQESARS